MLVEENKKRFWTVLSTGSAALLLSTIGYFYHYNVEEYHWRFKAEQEGHVRHQNKVKNQILSHRESELMALNRYYAMIPTQDDAQSAMDRALKQPTLASDHETPGALLEPTSVQRKLNYTQLEPKSVVLESNLPETSINSNALRSREEPEKYPDPVRFRPEFFTGLQGGVLATASDPDFSKAMLHANQTFSSQFLSGNLLSYRSEVQSNWNVGVIAGVEVKPWLEIQSGLFYQSVTGKATSIFDNLYEEEYTFTEWIVDDNADGGFENSYTYTREEKANDTLNSKFSTSTISVPLNLRLKKEFNNLTAFVSGGVLFGLQENSKLLTTSQLFKGEKIEEESEGLGLTAIQFGAGVDLKLNNSFSIRLEPTVQVRTEGLNSFDIRSSSSSVGANLGAFYRF